MVQLWVATNHTIEDLKKKKGDLEAQTNLKAIKDNPLLTTHVQRNMLYRYQLLTGTPGNDQVALIKPTDAQYQATRGIIS